MSSPAEIPKIIHQVWIGGDMPETWEEFRHSWRREHPGWDYRLWRDEQSLDFVKTSFPDFLGLFKSFSYHIQRANAVRYLVLFQYGGVYVDLDIECLRSVEDLLANKTFVIGYEPKEHAKERGEKSFICTAFMASVPGHPFLLEILNTMKKKDPVATSHEEASKTSGEMMVNEVFKHYSRKDVSILDPRAVYPFTYKSCELKLLINKTDQAIPIKKQLIENGSHAIHYWSNFWVRNLAGALINPNPLLVEGYQFYPGRDSNGYDLRNAGRDILHLVSACDDEDKALGFNTDGFLKSFIRPMDQWNEIDNPNGNEGLYVKKSYLPRLKDRSPLFFRVCKKLGAFFRRF